MSERPTQADANPEAIKQGPRALDGVSAFMGLRWDDPETVRLTIRPELINGGGLLSGVATYAMVDYSMGSTLWAQTAPEERIATISISINYIQTATAGEMVCRADARSKQSLDRDHEIMSIMRGRATAVYSGRDVFDSGSAGAEGRIVACRSRIAWNCGAARAECQRGWRIASRFQGRGSMMGAGYGLELRTRPAMAKQMTFCGLPGGTARRWNDVLIKLGSTGLVRRSPTVERSRRGGRTRGTRCLPNSDRRYERQAQDEPSRLKRFRRRLGTPDTLAAAGQVDRESRHRAGR